MPITYMLIVFLVAMFWIGGTFFQIDLEENYVQIIKLFYSQ